MYALSSIKKSENSNFLVKHLWTTRKNGLFYLLKTWVPKYLFYDYFQFLKFGRFAKHDTFSRTLIRPTTILPCMIVTRVKLGKDMVLYFYDTKLKCLKFGHARINGLRRLFFFVFLRNNDKMLRTKIKVKPLCA